MRALVLAVLLAVASPALAQEPTAPEPPAQRDPAEVRREAIRLDTQAKAAWEQGDSKAAAQLWNQAADLLGGEPVLRYNAGVAKEAAGDVDGALEAYESALSGAPGRVESNALFNASAVTLGQAWDALRLTRASPEELAQLLQGQTGPDGDPLSPEHVAQAAPALQEQAAKQGIEFAKKSIGHLRDLVRRGPTDRDALHNLELAQRVRKDLKQELEKLEEQQQSDQQNQQQKDESDNENQGKQEDENEQPPEDQEQQGENEDESEQEGQQGEGEQDQQQDEQEEAEQSEGKAEQQTKEQAERQLEQMLEAAQRKARKVREARELRARRTPVEKDW